MSIVKNANGNLFGKRLAALMESRGLTQASLGTAIGVSQATIFKWLNGTMPRSGELYRLAKFLGHTMEWFLADIQSEMPSQEESDTTAIMDGEAHKLKAVLNSSGISLDQIELFIDGLRSVTEPPQDVSRGIASQTTLDNESEVFKVPLVNKGQQLLNRLISEVAGYTKARGAKAALARAAGVSRQAVSSWLSGTASPTAEAALFIQQWILVQKQKESSHGSVYGTAMAVTPRKVHREKNQSGPSKRRHRKVGKSTK